MGYYYCKKCKKFFTVDHRVIPRICRFCKSKHFLYEMSKSMFEEWQRIEQLSEQYRLLQEEVVWDRCCRVWNYKERVLD